MSVSRLFDDGPVADPFERIPNALDTLALVRTEGDQGDPDFYDKWARLEQKPKPFKKTEHFPRAIKIVGALYPGKYWRVEHAAVLGTWGGNLPRIVSQDMLGFADILGVTPPHGTAVAVQVTTKTQVHAHLRKYTNPNETHGQAKTPIEIHLREFLEMGCKFYVLGFHQSGGKGSKWDAEVVEVTADVLDVYKSRKRK